MCFSCCIYAEMKREREAAAVGFERDARENIERNNKAISFRLFLNACKYLSALSVAFASCNLIDYFRSFFASK
jgi:hypothetical protein